MLSYKPGPRCRRVVSIFYPGTWLDISKCYYEAPYGRRRRAGVWVAYILYVVCRIEFFSL